MRQRGTQRFFVKLWLQGHATAVVGHRRFDIGKLRGGTPTQQTAPTIADHAHFAFGGKRSVADGGLHVGHHARRGQAFREVFQGTAHLDV